MNGLIDDFNMHFAKYTPELITMDPNRNNHEEISNELYKYYTGESLNFTNANIAETFGLLYSDAIISHGVHRFVDLTKNYTNVFYYMFDYPGQYGKIKGADGKPLGKFLS